MIQKCRSAIGTFQAVTADNIKKPQKHQRDRNEKTEKKNSHPLPASPHHQRPENKN
jgi:hypothetical protein